MLYKMTSSLTSTHLVAYTAIFFSACSILINIVAVPFVFTSVSRTEQQVRMSMAQFKVTLLYMTTNNAWNNMIGIRSITSRSLWSTRPQRSLEMQTDVPKIECPPGKPGEDGEPGEDGLPGENGRDGYPGKPMIITNMNAYCMTCPAGPEGSAGKTGPRGKRGPKGIKGENGIPGVDGMEGMVGPPGFPGPEGLKGDRGGAGYNGMNRPGGKGKPGPKGMPGAIGRAGDQGINGKENFSEGPAGNSGKRGFMGQDGQPGRNGERGLRGYEGYPGVTQDFCPCPKEQEKIDAQRELEKRLNRASFSLADADIDFKFDQPVPRGRYLSRSKETTESSKSIDYTDIETTSLTPNRRIRIYTDAPVKPVEPYMYEVEETSASPPIKIFTRTNEQPPPVSRGSARRRVMTRPSTASPPTTTKPSRTVHQSKNPVEFPEYGQPERFYRNELNIDHGMQPDIVLELGGSEDKEDMQKLMLNTGTQKQVNVGGNTVDFDRLIINDHKAASFHKQRAKDIQGETVSTTTNAAPVTKEVTVAKTQTTTEATTTIIRTTSTESTTTDTTSTTTTTTEPEGRVIKHDDTGGIIRNNVYWRGLPIMTPTRRFHYVTKPPRESDYWWTTAQPPETDDPPTEAPPKTTAPNQRQQWVPPAPQQWDQAGQQEQQQRPQLHSKQQKRPDQQPQQQQPDNRQQQQVQQQQPQQDIRQQHQFQHQQQQQQQMWNAKQQENTVRQTEQAEKLKNFQQVTYEQPHWPQPQKQQPIEMQAWNQQQPQTWNSKNEAAERISQQHQTWSNNNPQQQQPTWNNNNNKVRTAPSPADHWAFTSQQQQPMARPVNITPRQDKQQTPQTNANSFRNEPQQIQFQQKQPEVQQNKGPVNMPQPPQIPVEAINAEQQWVQQALQQQNKPKYLLPEHQQLFLQPPVPTYDFHQDSKTRSNAQPSQPTYSSPRLPASSLSFSPRNLGTAARVPASVGFGSVALQPYRPVQTMTQQLQPNWDPR